jgi:hypothetical protein
MGRLREHLIGVLGYSDGASQFLVHHLRDIRRITSLQRFGTIDFTLVGENLLHKSILASFICSQIWVNHT